MKKVVMANGCFDILHVGHITHLEEARTMGDTLIVALTLDEYVKKGPSRPVYTWAERVRVLRALRCVDLVVPSSTGEDSVLEYRPSIFVKGADWARHLHAPSGSVLQAACRSSGTELRLTAALKRSVMDDMRKARTA